jgi:hypothetical protein
MTTLKIEIETGNAAFSPYMGEEVARILRELADEVEPYGELWNLHMNLRDANGNVVGKAWEEQA